MIKSKGWEFEGIVNRLALTQDLDSCHWEGALTQAITENILSYSFHKRYSSFVLIWVTLLSLRVPFYVVNSLVMLPIDICEELNTNFLRAKHMENKQRAAHMERSYEQTIDRNTWWCWLILQVRLILWSQNKIWRPHIETNTRLCAKKGWITLFISEMDNEKLGFLS